jgi:hypothetical protein
VTLTDELTEPLLSGKSVFLSASIPDPERWDGYFDPLEITDAVVAISRAVLSAGGRLITATHPTIAPLLLYVAAELLEDEPEPRVVVYQSQVFANVLPEATRRFEAEGIGLVIRTEAVEGEPPDPRLAPRSLEVMRRQMFTQTRPDAAVFIGGMEGIPRERALFGELRPERPTYALGYPGGAARDLAREIESPLRDLLLEGAVYPAIARTIVRDIRRAIS